MTTATITLPPLPPNTSALIRVTINPSAPAEPKRPRDARGRFTRRTGIVITEGDCGGVHAEYVAIETAEPTAMPIARSVAAALRSQGVKASAQSGRVRVTFPAKSSGPA